jgi:hypothetical protein
VPDAEEAVMARMSAVLACVLACSCGHHDEESIGGAIDATLVPAVGGASGTKTFGEACSASAPCTAGLSCVSAPAGSSGVCSRSCALLNDECAEAPGKSVGLCALKAGDGKLYCALVCKVVHTEHSHTYSCPASLTCPTTEAAPGTGVYLCSPQ